MKKRVHLKYGARGFESALLFGSLPFAYQGGKLGFCFLAEFKVPKILQFRFLKGEGAIV